MINTRSGFRMSAISLLLLAASMTGCVIDGTEGGYDDQLDRQVTEIQRKSDALFQTLLSAESPAECSYATTRNFHPAIQVELDVLETRAKAGPDSAPIVRQVEAMKGIFLDLQHLQRINASRVSSGRLTERCGVALDADSRKLIQADKQALDTAVGNIIRIELSKKLGTQGAAEG